MKLFSIFLILYSGSSFSQSGIYKLVIRTPDGNMINMSKYKGQKILIASLTTGNLKTTDLNFWDSLQKNNSGIAVLLIPANDPGKPFDSATMKSISNDLSKNLVLSVPVSVKKTSSQIQDPMLQWLTHADQNGHFNEDVTSDQQIYLVSESGILYAVLEKGVSVAVIDQALRQKDVTE